MTEMHTAKAGDFIIRWHDCDLRLYTAYDAFLMHLYYADPIRDEQDAIKRASEAIRTKGTELLQGFGLDRSGPKEAQ